MKANEIREYLAPRYQDLKFKGFQQVYFLLNECLEEGVIMDFVKSEDKVFYRIAYLDNCLNIIHKTIEESAIFENHKSVDDFLRANALDSHGILKHHLQTYTLMMDKLKMEVDEYIIHSFFHGKMKSEFTPSQELVKVNRWASKVLAMRNSQNKYFRDRNYQDLTQSKALEKEVDEHMEDAIKSLASITSFLM